MIVARKATGLHHRMGNHLSDVLEIPNMEIPSTVHEMKNQDPVLARYRKALDSVYGKRIERIVLFGSRARGSHRPDSDYDIAIFLHDLSDPWMDIGRIAEVELDIMDDTGAFIHTTPFPAGSWNSRTPLMADIRREGVEL